MSEDLHVDITAPLIKLREARKAHQKGKITDAEFAAAQAEFRKATGDAGVEAVMKQKKKDESQ